MIRSRVFPGFGRPRHGTDATLDDAACAVAAARAHASGAAQAPPPRRARAAALLAAASAAAICASCGGREPVAPPPAPAPVVDSVLEIPSTGLVLVVDKSERVLTVYHDGAAVFEFPVVMGRNGRGPKRFEGDMRTPEGVYRVTEKRPHERWRYFIELDYPNDEDVARYAAAVSQGDVPVVRGEFMGIGGELGIHGSDRLAEQQAGLDWTRGCVAMRSEDVEQLYSLVELGTRVLIVP